MKLLDAWLFPGQGAQYPDMGRHLWRNKLAREILSMAENISGLPLSSVIEHGPESKLRSPEYLEPSIFALQAAYVHILQAEGIHPDVVAGYSLGEVGALYCAGCLSLLDALNFVAARGRILSRHAKAGQWSSVAVGFASNPPALPLDGTEHVYIGAYNSPRDFTVTGRDVHVHALERILAKTGVACFPVAIDGPWHSPLASDAARETAQLASSLVLRKPDFPVYLGTSGEFVTETEVIRASLSRQIESPILWTKTIQNLWEIGVRSTVEIGPGRVLTSFLRNNWAKRDYRSQFMERQGGRPFDFAAIRSSKAVTLQPQNNLQNHLDKETTWTKSA